MPLIRNLDAPWMESPILRKGLHFSYRLASAIVNNLNFVSNMERRARPSAASEGPVVVPRVNNHLEKIQHCRLLIGPSYD